MSAPQRSRDAPRQFGRGAVSAERSERCRTEADPYLIESASQLASFRDGGAGAYGIGGIVGWARYDGAAPAYAASAPIAVTGCTDSASVQCGRQAPNRRHGLLGMQPHAPRSLISFDDQLWLPSPELLFLQMHGHLTGLECIALGFELCGHYCPRGTEAYEYDLPPVTSPDKLRRYLNRSAGLRHCDRARRALRFVRPSSASLRETQLALLLSLPFRYGGYAFSDPVLNRPIDVSPISGSKWSRDARRTDISWEGEPVAVEYDSNEFHSGREKIERDAKRRTLLQAAGFHVVVVTNDQLKKIAEMDRVERTLNHLMSARRRNRIADYELRERRLHQAILRLDT